MDARMLASLGGRLDFRECGPCGGHCCTMPWAVFATEADLARLLAWLREDPAAEPLAERLAAARGVPRERLDASDVADLAPLPAWEAEAYGEGNLLWPRVLDRDGRAPLLKKTERGCAFLEADGRCGVHPAKPLLCRLFPYYFERKGPTLLRIVDRGWAGNCPITPARMDEVAAGAGPALDALFAAFEREVEEHGRAREALRASWPALTRP